MEHFFDVVHQYTGVTVAVQYKIAKTVLLLLVVWGLTLIGYKVADALTGDATRRFHSRKAAKRVIWVLGVMAILDIWFDGVSSLATYLGLVSAGVAIALKDPLTDLAGWLIITFRKPFELSDRVEVGGWRGDVIDIRIFKFTLLEIGNWVSGDQPTGRVVHLPNSVVFRENVANYTEGFNFIWDEQTVTLTFDSDWRRAREIMQRVVEGLCNITAEAARREIAESKRRYLIKISDTRSRVVVAATGSGVTLTARYLVRPGQRRGFAEAFWENLLEAFDDEEDIRFAYTPVRVLDGTTTHLPASAKG